MLDEATPNKIGFDIKFKSLLSPLLYFSDFQEEYFSLQ